MIAPAVILTLLLTGDPYDVPDALIYGIAMRETGSEWRGRLVRRGLPDRGPDVSAWQISPAVIHDLRASAWRCRANPEYAESLARRWLAHLFRVTGSWPRAVAAYHAGLRKAGSAAARAYAEEVLNLAALYVP